MVTALYDEYVTLGGLQCSSRAIECFEFAGLKGSAKRHAGNWVAAGVAGSTARKPVEDELRVVLKFRINGAYTQDNVPVAASSRVSNFYTLRALLFAELEDNATQTITLTRPGGGPHSASCNVVRIGDLEQDDVPWIAELSAMVALPGGALL